MKSKNIKALIIGIVINFSISFALSIPTTINAAEAHHGKLMDALLNEWSLFKKRCAKEDAKELKDNSIAEEVKSDSIISEEVKDSCVIDEPEHSTLTVIPDDEVAPEE